MGTERGVERSRMRVRCSRLGTWERREGARRSASSDLVEREGSEGLASHVEERPRVVELSRVPQPAEGDGEEEGQVQVLHAYDEPAPHTMQEGNLEVLELGV